MQYRFPRLAALARRMVPFERVDPDTPLGPCKYCDRAVRYADGDRDPQGNARHDGCERAAVRRQLRGPRAEMLFYEALGLLRNLPDVKPALRDRVAALPRNYGPREMIGVIAAVLPDVETERTLSLAMKRDVVRALSDVRRRLAGIDATT